MDALREILSSIPEPYLWIGGGIVAEVLLQIIKRYLWQPADEDKWQKLVAAAVTSLALAFVAAGFAWPETAVSFIAIFCAAIGYHETTDKLGVKAAWDALTAPDLPGYKPVR